MNDYWKFLGPNLTGSNEFYYPAPTWNPITGKWKPSAWICDPNPDRTSKVACGHGLHLMKICKPVYTRYTGNCYLAEGKELLGEDAEKARFAKVRLLRPVMPAEIFKPKADLSGADLSGAIVTKEQLATARNVKEAIGL